MWLLRELTPHANLGCLHGKVPSTWTQKNFEALWCLAIIIPLVLVVILVVIVILVAVISCRNTQSSAIDTTHGTKRRSSDQSELIHDEEVKV